MKPKTRTRVGRRWCEDTELEMILQVEELINDDPPYQIISVTAVPYEQNNSYGGKFLKTKYLIVYSQAGWKS